MDLVARCVTASLLVSHGVRADTEFVAVLTGPPRPPRQVRFVGSEIRSLNPDERSTASLVRKALTEEGLAERSPHRGIYVAGRGFRETLDIVPPPIYLLAEGGTDLRAATLPADASFVLSDHRDFTGEEESLMTAKTTAKLSVGPKSLQADQVIAIVHNELDRRG
jgi:tRNA (pseudouridine54-N1)-methyltransferase